MTDAPGSANRNEEGATGLERLRVERERRGLERQQVADELHVDPWIIEALEAGRFDSLGAPVYALGHLRKYAELLGLDAEQLLSSFGQIDRQPPPLVRITPARQPRHEVPVTLVSALVVGVVVIGTAWWALTERKAAAPSVPTSTPTPEPTAAAADAAIVEAPAASATEDTVTSAAPAVPPPAEPTRPESAAESASVGTPVRLRLSFSADSWVELHDASGQRIFFDLGPANSVRSFSTMAPVRVFLGNAEGVQLELNGQAVALPERVIRGNVARFTVDARGRVRKTEG
jgi:cytoskeleton protein RodZ